MERTSAPLQRLALPGSIIFLLCPGADKATRATRGQAVAIFTQEVPHHRIGHHNGRGGDTWGYIEFVFLAWGKRQRDLTGGVVVVTEAALALLRIRREQAFPRSPLFFPDLVFALPLAPVKTLGINDGVWTTVIRLCTMAYGQLEMVLSG
jgi:hypothetical protein